jgi:Zn-dependent protease with chaperone function
MATLWATPAVQAVAWSLVHFLWQGALVGLAAALALRLMRRSSATSRYAVAAGALLLMLALPVATAWRLADGPASGEAAGGAAGAVVEPERGTGVEVTGPARAAALTQASPLLGGLSRMSAMASIAAVLPPVLPWIFGLWLSGVALLGAFHLGGWWRVRRLTRAGRPLGDERGDLEARLRDLGRRLGIARAIRLLESGSVAVPAVVGFLRPVILVPASSLAGLAPGQLEAILAHELAHVRRHDYLVNLLQAAVETLLFYHPAVWWVSNEVRRERENCCDDLAVAVVGDRLRYARALADLEGLRAPAPRLALAADGGSLLERVRRLVGVPVGDGEHGRRGGLAGRSWLAGLLALSLLPAGVTFRLVRGSAQAGSAVSAGSASAAQAARGEPTSASAADATAGGEAPGPASAGHAAYATAVGESRGAAGASNADHAGDATHASSSGRASHAAAAGDAVPADAGAGEDRQGTWSAERHGDKIDLETTMSWGGGHHRWQNGETYAVKDLAGLTAGPQVRFELRRDAGTFLFEGAFRGEKGSGFFTFQPSPAYAREMKSLGYQVSEDRLMELAIHDVSLAFVKEIHALGYRDASLDKLVQFKIHGVSAAFIRALVELGYRDVPADQLVQFRIHGVSPEFVRGLADAGYHAVPADQLVQFRIHGVSPELVRSLTEAGYRDMPADELVQFRIHGVSPEFVRGLANQGYRNVPVDELVQFRIHGVSPEFVHEMAAAGYPNVPPDELIQFRIHGVDAAFARQAVARYGKLSPSDLVQLKIRGRLDR